MSYVFHRHCHHDYPQATTGEGPFLVDAQGKRYFDGSSGAAVSCLGHNHPEVQAAMHKQIDKLAYAHTSFFTTEPMEELAEFLITHAPENIAKAYFVSGGSEAIEASLKLARQYFIEQGNHNKKMIIARKQSYHGNTLGALAAGGNQWRRDPFEPLLIDSHHIPPCYAYREQKDGESEEEYAKRAASYLEQTILNHGPENVMAFYAEPVVGATMGCVPAVKNYFKHIKAICQRHNVLLILDEVMCGMGRTGTLFACEQDDITADIITVAKGLAGGYQPIGAALVSHKIYQTIADNSGFFQHGHTYIGHTTACATALAVQKIIQQEELLLHVTTCGQYLEDYLHQAFDDHPYVGNIRGKGFFYGIEFVEDKETKQPFRPEQAIHHKIKQAGLNEGLLCYAMGGTIDGKQGNHVMLAPPYISTKDQIEQLVTLLKQSIDRVFQ